MKKLLITSLIILSSVSGSCYDASQNATVHINLGKIPLERDAQMSFIDRIMGIFEKDAWAAPSDVAIVHIAAVKSGSILTAISIDPDEYTNPTSGNEYIELSIPAGEGIDIIAVGEYNLEGKYANYYGRTPTPQTFNAGETSTVDITMNIDYMYDVNPAIHYSAPYYISWNKIPGALYLVQDNTLGTTVYNGTGSNVEISGDNLYNDYTLTVIFDFADLSGSPWGFGGG